jgi:hypothetical protein
MRKGLRRVTSVRHIRQANAHTTHNGPANVGEGVAAVVPVCASTTISVATHSANVDKNLICEVWLEGVARDFILYSSVRAGPPPPIDQSIRSQ